MEREMAKHRRTDPGTLSVNVRYRDNKTNGSNSSASSSIQERCTTEHGRADLPRRTLYGKRENIKRKTDALKDMTKHLNFGLKRNYLYTFMAPAFNILRQS